MLHTTRHSIRKALLLAAFWARPLWSLKQHQINRKPQEEQQVDIVVVAFGDANLIRTQYQALQKFLQDAFSYTVVDNSPDYAKRVELQAYCKEADIRYVGLPKNPYTGYSASDSHGLALNWAYRRLLRHGGATVWAFLDHDIFPTAPYSITEKLKTQPVYGHLQVRDEVWYLWPGFCFIRAEVAAPRGLNFMPIPGADTGAGNFSLLYQHLRRADLNFPDHVYEKVSLEGEETEGRVERLDSWLHVIGASDWSKSGAVKAYRHLLK